jgi:haloalkane dehalogenase
MSHSSEPFAPKKFLEIKGRRMACIDEGQGASIVFQHGNPTSSYLWRNVMPMAWSDFPERARATFRAFRSPDGEDMVLRDNAFVERVLPGSMIRQLSSAEMDHYRRPFVNPGEDRRPTLTWPRQIPLDGEPADVVKVVSEYGRWLAQSQVPKLYFHTEPGALDHGRQREFCRTWPNQTEVSVKGIHFVQEDSPIEIGAAVANFVRSLRRL